MKSRKLVLPLLALFVALGFASCKKAADLMKYKDEAMTLITKYKPQLEGLKPKLAGLLTRAEALKNIPGFDKLQAMLGDADKQATETAAKFASFPAEIETAVKSGKMDSVNKVIGSIKEAGVTVEKITASVTAAEAEATKLEADAKAAGAGSADPAAAAAATAAVEYAFKLDSGFELKGAKDGIEEKLVTFVKDATKVVDKTTWFSFDRLTFQTGKAELDMEKSKAQLENIKEILGAFPTLKLKLGGYTDNVGKPEDNKKLSQDRANSVMKALVDMGIKADRLEAEGYGQEHPVCAANDTDECNAKNRRIDVRVTAK